jgi:phosphate starvation-inducible PhoH-like protein
LTERVTKKIDLAGVDQGLLFGQNGVYLDILKKAFEINVVDRGDILTLSGEEKEVQQAETVINDLISYLRKNKQLNERYVLYSVSMVKQSGTGPADEMEIQSAVTSIVTRESIRPRTVGRKEYVQAMEKYDLVFAIGPAGTGKTFLAVAQAVASLKQKRVTRIVLCRPAIEAGESLGFLPGDIRAKVDPYLRPVYDALHEMVPADKIARLMELATIEIVPLAFMRGRTLNHSFVILDEGQNTTSAQMKMFLTRLGENSKAVVTGDITQIDLDRKKESGLIKSQGILKGIEGIQFVYLTERDVVRHKLVSDIIKAYEKYESKYKEGRH